jgi:hypothetical protein
VQQIRDSEAEQWILREFRLDYRITTKELCVVCADGEATLNGTVAHYAEKLAAQTAALRSPGIHRILNNISVSKPSAISIASGSRSANRPNPTFPDSQQRERV